jgi:hypothetical protein
VQVGQAPFSKPNYEGVFTYGWTTWAVSADGETWSFVAQSGGLTSDPGQSLKLIHTSDNKNLYIANNGDHNNRFNHIAMVHNPSDNYFYIVMGWSGVCGLKATWWRIHFDQNNPYGLPTEPVTGAFPEVQVLNNVDHAYHTSELTNGSTGVTNGLVTDYSDTWQCRAQSPSATAYNAAEPSDIVQLYTPTGAYDSMLFLYQSEEDYPTRHIHYVRTMPGTSPTPTGEFPWQAPQELNLTALGNWNGKRYWIGDQDSGSPTAGGFFVCVNQNGTSNGYPLLYGFLTTYRLDLHADNVPGPPYYGLGLTGYLPLRFSLNGN